MGGLLVRWFVKVFLRNVCPSGFLGFVKQILYKVRGYRNPHRPACHQQVCRSSSAGLIHLRWGELVVRDMLQVGS